MIRIFWIFLFPALLFAQSLQPIGLLPFANKTSSFLFDPEGIRQATADGLQEAGYLILPPLALDTAKSENKLSLKKRGDLYRLSEVTHANSFMKGELLQGEVSPDSLTLSAKYYWLDSQGHLLAAHRETAKVSLTEQAALEEVSLTLFRKMAKKAVQAMQWLRQIQGIVIDTQGSHSFSISLTKKDGITAGTAIRIEDAGDFVGYGVVTQLFIHKSLVTLTLLARGKNISPNQQVSVVEEP